MKNELKYETTKDKPKTPHEANKLGAKSVFKDMQSLSTFSITWFLVKRHKMFIVTSWAVIVSVYYFVPFVPDMILGMLK